MTPTELIESWRKRAEAAKAAARTELRMGRRSSASMVLAGDLEYCASCLEKSLEGMHVVTEQEYQELQIYRGVIAAEPDFTVSVTDADETGLILVKLDDTVIHSYRLSEEAQVALARKQVEVEALQAATRELADVCKQLREQKNTHICGSDDSGRLNQIREYVGAPDDAGNDEVVTLVWALVNENAALRRSLHTAHETISGKVPPPANVE